MGIAYQRPLYKNFHAGCVSAATLTNVVTLILTIVLTLVFAWTTRNFWVYRQSYAEQPKVVFTRDLIVEVENAGTVYTYSTIPEYTALVPSAQQRVPTVQLVEDDTNRDGYTDDFRITVKWPVADMGGVSHVRGVFLFSYFIDDRVRLLTQAAAYVDLAAGSPSGQVTVVGDLSMKEPRTLFPDHGTVSAWDIPAINPDALYSRDDADFASFMRDYQMRNVTVAYDHATPIWSSYKGDGFTLDATIRVPKQSFWYKPGFWESIKFAWVQVLSIGFVLLIIRSYVLDFIYTNHLISTRVVHEGAVSKQHTF